MTLPLGNTTTANMATDGDTDKGIKIRTTDILEVEKGSLNGQSEAGWELD